MIPKKNKNRMSFLIEWGIVVTIISLSYFTDWHKEVIAKLQQGIMMTGLFNASEEIPSDRQVNTDYALILEDESGNQVKLSEFKSQVLFINFWATWCTPCRAEMPEIAALYERKRDDVRFIMIAEDADFENAKKFITKKGYKFPIYRLVSGLSPEFENRYIPRTYVVSTEGKIIFQQNGYASYNHADFIKLLDNAKK